MLRLKIRAEIYEKENNPNQQKGIPEILINYIFTLNPLRTIFPLYLNLEETDELIIKNKKQKHNDSTTRFLIIFTSVIVLSMIVSLFK